jgi:hypothetical protein
VRHELARVSQKLRISRANLPSRGFEFEALNTIGNMRNVAAGLPLPAGMHGPAAIGAVLE